MGSGLAGSPLTDRIGHRDITAQGDGTMALIILSARLRGELEDLVLRTPLAKARRRSQALLWPAVGLPAAQAADTFQVSRQTVHNWLDPFLRREGRNLRDRLLDAP